MEKCKCWVNLGPLDDDTNPPPARAYAAKWKADLSLDENNLGASDACSWEGAESSFELEDDGDFPEANESHLCCRSVPWLDVPEDGMERLDDAC